MGSFTALTEVCEKCGCEITGEVCVNCYTKEDQTFESYTPAENTTKFILLSLGYILFSIAIYTFEGAHPEMKESLSNSTKIITITCQLLLSFCAYFFVLLKKINLKAAKSIISLGAIIAFIFILKG